MPSAPLPAPRRRRWLSILLALLVFMSGLAIGAAGAVAFIVHQVQYTIHHPALVPERAAARLASKLSLTPVQQAQVREVITRHQAKIQHLRREVQPRIEVELQGVYDEVAAVLDPKQCATWQALYSDFKAKWLPSVPGAPTTVPTTAPSE